MKLIVCLLGMALVTSAQVVDDGKTSWATLQAIQNATNLLASRTDATNAASATTNSFNAAWLTTGILPNARLSAIPNSALANSTISVDGTTVALGGSVSSAPGLNQLPAGTLTNKYAAGAPSILLSNNLAIDATHKFSLSNLTANALVKAGADNTVVSADLTGDVTTSAGVVTTLAAGNAGNLNSGTLLAARMPALTGDITTSAGAVATTLAAGNAGNLNSGTLLAARMPALSGDITTSAGAIATTAAKKIILRHIGGCTGNVGIPASVTIFCPLNNSSTNCLVWTTDASGGTRGVSSSTLTFTNFYVVSSVNPGTSKATLTLMTNGTAGSVTAGPSGGTTANDTTHSDTIIAGVEYGMKIVIAASATTAKYAWGLDYYEQ